MGYLKDTISGTFWVGGSQAFRRLFSYVRIAILARILFPRQFGLFGIANLILGFLEIITETGINVFLIQEKRNIDKYINTSWVISIIRGIIISLLIVIFTPSFASFFNSEESRQLLYLIAIVPFLRGFINPSIIKLQKELNFKSDSVLTSITFFIDTIVAVTACYFTRSPVGLVLGPIAAVLVEIVISFKIVDPKPKLIFDSNKFKEIIKKGKWVTFYKILHHVNREGDDVVVAKILSEKLLGIYQSIYKISILPLTEISQISHKVTFPIYSKIESDKDRLKKAFFKTFIVVSLLAFLLGLVLYKFPREVILIILGDRWIEGVGILKFLAIYGVIKAILNIPNSLFLAIKEQKWVVNIFLIENIVMFSLVVPLTYKYQLLGTAAAVIIGTVFSIPISIYYLVKVFRNPHE